MDYVIGIGLVAAYLVLQTWLLPRMGVPTCAVPHPRRGATDRAGAATTGHDDPHPAHGSERQA